MRIGIARAALLLVLFWIAGANAGRAADLDISRNATVCDRGSTNVRFRCFARELSRLSAEVERMRTLASLDTRQFIKYGDRAKISVSPGLCLHSGLFAGFEGCDIPGARGFYLERSGK